MSNVSPYLNFDGNASQVIEFYKKALGAELKFLIRYEEAPFPSPENWKQKIMHATLMLNGSELMISDAMPDSKVKPGDQVSIALSFEKDDRIDEKFKLLSQGGTVTMELQETFWSKKFGMCTDPFGIHWMVSLETPR